jgi:hypothetical protein
VFSSGRSRTRHVFSLPSRPSTANELARRVQALAVTAEQEVRNLFTLGDFIDSFGQEIPPNLTYREEELLELYEDLLALPNDEARVTAPRVSTKERDRALVETIVSRLSPLPSAPDPSHALSALLYQRSASNLPHIPAHETSSATLPHCVALGLLAPVIQELTAIRIAHTEGPSSTKDVPLAMLSVEEWRSLIRVCVRTCHCDLH